MFNEFKLAFQSFKKNWADYLAMSFVFAMIVFIGFLVGQLVIGLLLAFILVMIPAIISLKFCVYQAYEKPNVEYKSFKIGFLTLFKSIRVYFVVILKPLLIGFGVGFLVYYLFFLAGVDAASETMPNILESMENVEAFTYTIEEMLSIKKVNNIITFGTVASLVVGYLIYFCLKLKRDFIPFVAFEMPINSKRAITMNGNMLKKKQYIKFLIPNLVILAMFLIPGGLAFLVKLALETNEVLSPTTVSLLTTLAFLVLSSPIITFKQLHYLYAYKNYAKPFKEDFNNELKNVIKEMEELAKKIDKNDEN